MITEATLTCPRCGHRSREAMPETVCIVRHTCEGCGMELRPKSGDCCVFCSYADAPCPPRQVGQACCGDSDTDFPAD